MAQLPASSFVISRSTARATSLMASVSVKAHSELTIDINTRKASDYSAEDHQESDQDASIDTATSVDTILTKESLARLASSRDQH